MGLLGPRDWFGAQWVTPAGAIAADTVVAAASLVLVFRSRVWAATLAEAGLLVLGAYGLLITRSGPPRPGSSTASPAWPTRRPPSSAGLCRVPPCLA